MMSEKINFQPLPLGWRWQLLFHSNAASNRVFGDIEQAYAEPHRHYHTLDHIESGLNVLDQLGADSVVKVAFWFHDVIYDAGASNNEERSAAFAYSTLFPSVLGWTEDAKHEMERLIYLTKDHKVDWWDKNACHMAVADLHGLGSEPETYKRNSENVRLEYGKFSDDEWKEGRIKFLRAMLDRDIFPPFPAYSDLAQHARENMYAEWDRLDD